MAFAFLSSCARTLTLLIIFITSAYASNLTLADICPPSSVYSPFTKWPSALLDLGGPTKNSACWYWAECILDQAQEVRKSQFAATSFVMGLVPLILKDITWPERRQVCVPAPLNPLIEVLVRALGLVPIVSGEDAKLVRLPRKLQRSWERRIGSVVTLLLLIGGLFIAYAALIIMEYFSKRSSLGCPYYLFIFTWFVVALIPAAIRTCIPYSICFDRFELRCVV